MTYGMNKNFGVLKSEEPSCSEVTPLLEEKSVASFTQRLLRRQSTFWPSERALLFRRPSLELLVPAHDCASRKSSPAIAIFSLVATVCGGGVLSLPQAFMRAGLVPSGILMLLAAGVTNFSMYILCSCARRTGGRSYGDVARNAFGPLSEIIATILLVFLLFFVLVAYLVLLKDIWTPVLLQTFPALRGCFVTTKDANNDAVATTTELDSHDMNTASHYMLVILLLTVIPLLLQTDLHALRHTCYVGFGSAVVLMLGVTQQALQRNLWQEPGLFTQKVVWVGDVDGIMYAFPIIVLSFFSIYNVLTVHGALFNPTRSRVKFVLDGTIGLCFVLFYTVGLCGYLYAYDETKDNILLNFPLDVKTILVGRIGYGVTILFGLPLVFLPCRAAILSLPEQIRDRNRVVHQDNAEQALHSVMKGTRHHVANSLTFDEMSPLWKEIKKVPHDVEQQQQQTTVSITTPAASTDHSSSSLGESVDFDASQNDNDSDGMVIRETNSIRIVPVPKVDPALHHEAHRDQRVHVISTTTLLTCCYIMAVGVPGVGVVWSIAGSSMAMIIGFIIPSACYLKIRSKKSINPRSIGAFILLLFSIVASIECTWRTIAAL